MKKSLWMGAVSAIALLAATPDDAKAALVTCEAGQSGVVTYVDAPNTGNNATSGCQYITPADANNVASISNINTAGFFGFTDWEDNGQTQTDTNNQSSGTWSINAADFTTYDYLIVFKDGGNTNLVGFTLLELDDNGNWTTPFLDPPFNLPGAGTSRDVSHYTIARRGGDTPPPNDVPEPASLGLLGVGLAGLGWAAARRRRKAA